MYILLPLPFYPSHSFSFAYTCFCFCCWVFVLVFVEFTFRLLLFILRTFSELETNFISSLVYLFFLTFFWNTFLLSLALNAIALLCCCCYVCCGLCFMGQYIDIFGLSVPVSVVFDKLKLCGMCISIEFSSDNWDRSKITAEMSTESRDISKVYSNYNRLCFFIRFTKYAPNLCIKFFIFPIFHSFLYLNLSSILAKPKSNETLFQWLMQPKPKYKVQSSIYNGQKKLSKTKQSKQNARQGAKMELQINVENK